MRRGPELEKFGRNFQKAGAPAGDVRDVPVQFFVCCASYISEDK
jgi:hypothetical protein